MNTRNSILFLDATLHKKDATGITLSNLFGQWPKDSLFMIGDAERVAKSTTEGYKNTFTLGNDELKHAFPLGFLKSMLQFIREYKQKKTRNQTYTSQKTDNITNTNIEKQKGGIWRLTSGLMGRLFLGLGLDHLLFRCKISDRLDKWITEANPDFFYALLSTRHSILFATEVAKRYNKTLIIHIMDDWPATIGNDTLTPKLWNRKINSEFKRLLTFTEKRIAISQLMAEEYQKRFGGDWLYFHNPVVFSNWENFQKKHIFLPKKTLKIGYFGRIGKANEQSINIFINVVSSCQLAFPIEFHLYTNNTSSNLNIKNVFYHSFLDNSLMPAAISSFDFLLLPISFFDEDVKFAKYSIPTKLSEYLISGVPVIVFAPKNVALSEFVSKNICGLCINTSDIIAIASNLNDFFYDITKQRLYSENGKNIAFKEFESSAVGKRFNRIFEN